MQKIDEMKTLTLLIHLAKIILEVHLSFDSRKPVLRSDLSTKLSRLGTGLDSVWLNCIKRDFIKLVFLLFIPLSFPLMFK